MLFLAAMSLFAREPSITLLRVSLPEQPADTIYLDRNGKEINKGGSSPLEKTYIVRTTLTGGAIVQRRSDDNSHHVQPGKYHPILKKEAKRTEDLIRNGRFDEALATGNLIGLWPLSRRRADWGIVMQDNGKGDTVDANNCEYGITTAADSSRNTYKGPRRDPDSCCGAYVDVLISRTALTNTHSHPSGTHNNSSFYQPPSGEDIKLAPAASSAGKAYWTVFGMGSANVYLYDSSGVIAVLSIKRYIRY